MADGAASQSKADVKNKIDQFINNCFETLKLGEGDSISRTDASRILFELMKGHGYDEAWSNEEFNELFDLFQEDDPKLALSASGLDKSEFKKFVVRICQL